MVQVTRDEHRIHCWTWAGILKLAHQHFHFITGCNRVKILRYTDPEMGPRILPKLHDYESNRTVVGAGLVFQVDVKNGTVKLKENGTTVDVGQQMAYLVEWFVLQTLGGFGKALFSWTFPLISINWQFGSHYSFVWYQRKTCEFLGLIARTSLTAAGYLIVSTTRLIPRDASCLEIPDIPENFCVQEAS